MNLSLTNLATELPLDLAEFAMSKYADKFKISNATSPRNPWNSTKNVPIGLMWHHVLPIASLRAVWNRLCDLHVDTATPSARVAIRQYLLLLDSKLLRVDELVDRMRAETTQPIAGHNPLKPLDMGDILLLQSTASFPAWDLVEGPSNRSDDPKDNPKDPFDRFKTGLKPDELKRMKLLETLFHQFEKFSDAPGGSADSLIQAMALPAMDLKSVFQPISFRPEMWVKEGVKWKKAPVS